MIVTEIAHDDASEPVWDSVSLRGSDFRPHFDGDLINIFTTIYPLESKVETASLFKDIAFKIANWILTNKDRFSSGDRFQIIVGWPLDVRDEGRQVIKTGGTFADLQRLINDRDLIVPRERWAAGVFNHEHIADPKTPNQKRSYAAPMAIAVAILIAAAIIGFRVQWRQCQACGVQEYERSFFGIAIEPLSQREYDEFGTYSEWKKLNGRPQCSHQFKPVAQNSPATSLQELAPHQLD